MKKARLQGRCARALCALLIMPCAGAVASDEVKLLHRWSFNGSLEDSMTGGSAKYVGKVPLLWNRDKTAVSLQGGAAGTSGIDLGQGMIPMDGSPFTIEMWATQRSVKNWSRIFQFGARCDNMVNMCWTGQEGVDTDAVQVYARFPDRHLLKTSQRLAPYCLGREYHISMVVEPNRNGITYFSFAKRECPSGRIVAKGEGQVQAPWKISDVTCERFYLGHAHPGLWSDDAAADYNEVRVWKGALTDEELTAGVQVGPDEKSNEGSAADTSSSVEQTFEAGNFWTTTPLQSNDGYTWSMTSRIGDMLKEAESLFGHRDEKWTILGVELRADKGAVPQNWFPGYPKRKNIIFQVVPPANTDRAQALFQLAHEVVHSLSPHVGKTANVLEEGVATWFAERYACSATGVDIHSSLRSYANARDAVTKLLKVDETAIRRLRTLEPDFSRMTAKTFKDAHIAIDEDEIKALLATFTRE